MGAPVLVLYAWILTAGRWELLQRQYYDDFYDAQARALFDGRWDVPPSVVGSEGIAIDGRVHTYFGPLPALARMPVLAVTDRFDGRLTTLSMLAGMAVLGVFAFRLSAAVRSFVRGDAPITRTELVATALLAGAVLTGAPLWLASQAIVHHEAQLWGVALTVAAFDALARWLAAPNPRNLVTVTVLATLAMLTRQTLAAGVPLALGLAAAVMLYRRWQRERVVSASTLNAGLVLVAGRRQPGGSRWRELAGSWPLATASAVPFLVSAVPNMARFGRPFGVPFNRQIACTLPPWREFLADNGGHFRLRFVPTTLLQYFRPDAFDVRPDFPWIDYATDGPTVLGGQGPTVLGGVTWGPSDVTSSIPVTMPALTLLAIGGLVVLVRAVRRRQPTAWLAWMVAGAAVGGVGVLLLGSITNRYMNDLYPAVLIPALVGFHALMERNPPTRRLITLGTVVVLAGALTNTALALEYQRERGLVVPESWRADWIRTREALPTAREPLRFARTDVLPEATPDGRLAIVGDCDGLYLRVGGRWVAIERGPEVGVHDLEVELDALDGSVNGRAPIATLGEGPQATVVAALPIGDGQVRIDVWDGTSQQWSEGPAFDPDDVQTVRLDADPRAIPDVLTHGANHRHDVVVPHDAAPLLLGHAPGVPGVANRYPGPITLQPADHTTCEVVL